MTQRTNYRDAAVTGFEPAGGSPVAVAWPDTESGDRVLLLCSGEGNGTDTFTPAGSWTSLGKTGGGTGITFQVYQLDGDASGSETGTFDVEVSPTNTDYSFICVSIANQSGSTEAEFTSGTTGQADPPSITPSGGSQHYTFVVGASIDGAGRHVGSWPSEYGQWVSDTRGTERVAFCVREAVESSEDPGAFNHASDGWAACTIAIPTTAPDNAGFPISEARATSEWTTQSTSQTMNLPASIQVGELLVAEVSADAATTATITDWTVIGSQVEGVNVGVTILAKTADGTEGATATVTLSGVDGEEGSAICSRISGATIDDIEAALAALGSTTTPDPPANTPAGGSAEILWLVGWGSDGGGPTGDIQTQTFPIRFGADTLQIRHTNSGGASIVSGFRTEETVSVDPPAGVMQNNRPTVAYTVAVYPAASVPAAPTNPAATALSASSIRIAWDDVADETGYRVERSDDGIGGWADVSGNLPADTVSYDDTGLTASTQYFYRIFAFNASGDSSPSTVVDATTSAASGNRMGGTGAIRRRGGYPR